MFPWIQQLDERDCGPACLAIVCRFYGRRRSVTQIRELAGTDRDGTNLFGIVHAAEKLGFWAKAYVGDHQQLLRPELLPAIAHLETDHGLHYVVVYRITPRRVSVSDPAIGRRTQPRTAFLGVWTGHLILLAPANRFDRDSVSGGPLARYVPVLVSQVRPLTEAFVASFVLVVLGIAQFVYVRFLVDSVIPGAMTRALVAATVVMVGLSIGKVTLETIRSYLLAHAGNRMDLQIVFAYVSHLLRLPMAFFDRRRVGEVMTRLDDVAAIRSALSGVTLSAAMDLVMILAVGLFLLSQSAVLTVVAVIPVIPSVLSAVLLVGLYERNYRHYANLEALNQSHLTEVLTNIFTVKGLNAERQAFLKAETRLVAALRQDFRLEFIALGHRGVIGLAEGVGQVALYAVGAWLILEGRLSLGQLISFAALSTYLTDALQNLFTLQPSLQNAAVAARRIGEILDLEPESEEAPVTRTSTAVTGRIRFDAVSFRYGTRRDVLTDVSFAVEPGQYVGIVGSTGSGKSTIVKLLLKLYQPSSGCVYLDDSDLRDLDTVVVRKSIGYVPQEVALFQGSIWENLVYRDPSAPFEDVLQAAIRAHAHEFICRLPDRYETAVGERGVTLSGGERQRIALSRALLGRPRVLVLDEATSALDTATEEVVQLAIEGLAGEGTTVLHIAHRLSTIRRCSRVLVLEDGQIVEQGTHDDLIGANGQYHRLWERQAIR